MISAKRNHYRCFVFTLMVCGVLQGPLSAGPIFQSASAPTSQYPALAVANSDFVQQAAGVRFQITQTTLVDSIGVWAYHNNNTASGGLFGEIFLLPNLAAFPSTDPYSSSGLGRAYFPANDSGLPSDLVAPLSLTLTPGYYALVIGSLPSTEWAIPLNGVESPGVGADLIMYLGGNFFSAPPYPRWQQGPSGMRFFVNGEVAAVPELPSALLVLASLPLAGALRSNRQRATEKCRRLLQRLR